MRWHWGNHLHQGRQNFIGAMVDRAEGELPGADISIPQELTPELEAVEKAVARMRGKHDLYREVIKDTYLSGMFTHELAGAWSNHLHRDRNWSPEYTKQILSRAELICWRYIQELDVELQKGELTKRKRSCQLA